MTVPPDQPALRRCALAVSVLHDLDLQPGAAGVTLAGSPPVLVGWQECRRALAGADPDGDPGRTRLHRWLWLRRRVADLPVAELAARVRPFGSPVESEQHPGLDWVQMRVLGDALDVGLGVVGVDPEDPDRVLPLPRRLLDAQGVDSDALWPSAYDCLERMGRRAVERYARRPDAPLRPMGDCDVVTLLASRELRAAISAGAQGMRPVAVPMRSRGWFDLTRIDPAFAVAAAAATDPDERGFPRPLLVTADEVAMTPGGGRPAEIVLRDPAVDQPWLRAVLYHS